MPASATAARPADDAATPAVEAEPRERVVLELTGERTPVGRLFRDYWSHRDLLVMLARQEYRSRYRSASLGLMWSVALPLVQGVVVAVVFSHLIGTGSAKTFIPYVLSGIVTWSYLQQSTTIAATSIVDGGAIAGKVYFPRLILPGVAASANLPGYCISLVVAEIVVLSTGGGIHPSILLVFALVPLAWLLVYAFGAVMALAHVYSRDVRYIVQALMMVLFYATPIIYALGHHTGARALPSNLRPYILANPATGVVQLAREALTGTGDYVGTSLLSTAAWIVGLAVIATFAYARLERVAMDRL